MEKQVFYTLLTASLVAIAFTSGCTSSGGTTTTTITGTTVAGNSVEIRNFAFSPQTLTIPAGSTVTWTNFDSAVHTLTADTPNNPQGFGSGDLSTGQTYSFTFTQSGTYAYHCGVHPNMKATIIVQ